MTTCRVAWDHVHALNGQRSAHALSRHILARRRRRADTHLGGVRGRLRGRFACAGPAPGLAGRAGGGRWRGAPALHRLGLGLLKGRLRAQEGGEHRRACNCCGRTAWAYGRRAAAWSGLCTRARACTCTCCTQTHVCACHVTHSGLRCSQRAGCTWKRYLQRVHNALGAHASAVYNVQGANGSVTVHAPRHAHARGHAFACKHLHMRMHTCTHAQKRQTVRDVTTRVHTKRRYCKDSHAPSHAACRLQHADTHLGRL